MNLDNKEIIIKFDPKLFSQLRNFLLQNQMEQMCYLFCHTSTAEESIGILPKKIIFFENDRTLLKKGGARVWLDTDMVNEVYYRFIESDFNCMINCHSHPFDNGEVFFSGIDDQSDRKEFEYFFSEIKKGKRIKQLSDNILPASIVMGQRTLAARTFDLEKRSFVPIDRIKIMTEPVQFITPTNKKKSPDGISSSYGTFVDGPNLDYSEIFNRQILAFGEEGQKVLAGLNVSIIGMGGIGSIVAEGLCRLGVRHFILVDHDKLELSNMNRWQGAEFKDDNRYKVDVSKEKLEKIFPGVTVKPIKTTLFDDLAVKEIKNSDCLLGCLDNHETRFFLNRLSLQYLIPLIDGSTVIHSRDGKVEKMNIRSALVLPGRTRCLDCSMIQYYDIRKVKEFFLDAETRRNLRQGGYIKGDSDIPAPAVYPLNMSIASLMLMEFLNLFTGFKPIYWNICLDLLNLDSKDRKHLSTEDLLEEPTGQCLICEDYKATGDSENLDYFLKINRLINLPED